MRKINRTLEEQIDFACKKVLLHIPEYLHCEDLYQDIVCIYLDIYSKHPDYSCAIIYNRIIYSHVNKLIDKYKDDKYNQGILPEYHIMDEDDMMLMITDIFGIIKNFVTDKEFDIICRRYINNETQESISIRYGINRERVRQIENKAIRKLRHPRCITLIQDFYR